MAVEREHRPRKAAQVEAVLAVAQRVLLQPVPRVEQVATTLEEPVAVQVAPVAIQAVQERTVVVVAVQAETQIRLNRVAVVVMALSTVHLPHLVPVVVVAVVSGPALLQQRLMAAMEVFTEQAAVVLVSLALHSALRARALKA